MTYFVLVQYLNAQRLKKKLDITSITLDRDSRILELAKAKVSSGVGIALDLMRLRGLVEIDNLRQLDLKVSFEKAKRDLLLL